MRLSQNFGSLLLVSALLFSYSAQAKTYVLSYEGSIDGEATTIETSINELFTNLDLTKASSEILYQNYPQTNTYTIEAFVEPYSEKTAAYVEDFVRDHSEFQVGNVKLQLKPAAKIAEFFAIQGFGPDEAGANEVLWGTLVQTRQFSSVRAYQSNIIELGMSLSEGNEDKIREALIPILNPVDGLIFQEWLTGMEPAKDKLSRFHWDSHSFFVMEDGRLVNRLMSWQFDRILKERTPNLPILDMGCGRHCSRFTTPSMAKIGMKSTELATMN